MFELPPLVEATARARGASGQRWLVELRGVVRSLEEDWELALGAVLAGGTAALVVEATTADGEPAVLKVALPERDDEAGSFERSIAFYELAGGQGTARLLRHDAARLATLMERLGPSIGDLGLSEAEARAAICACLGRLWAQPLPVETPLGDGADKARWLADAIPAMWEELGHPCHERTIDTVLGFIEQRIAAHDPERAVLVHGDAHENNTLQAQDGFKLVDPEGLRSMPAHDLSVPMRGMNDELLAGDALALGRTRALELEALTGVAAEDIWQWGSIERVSSGLYIQTLGHQDWGAAFLAVADAWSTR